MVTKEDFLKFIESVKKKNEFLDKCYDLGIDIIDSNIIKEYDNLMSLLENLWFTEVGIALIEWWLFEDVDKKIYSEANIDSVIADVNNPEDLYNYMVSEGEEYLVC